MPKPKVKQLWIRVTEDEFKAMARAADQENILLSELVRRRLFSPEPDANAVRIMAELMVIKPLLHHFYSDAIQALVQNEAQVHTNRVQATKNMERVKKLKASLESDKFQAAAKALQD